MEKKNIETFIKKYNLNGAIEGVLWTNNNGDLAVTATTSDRKLFASVTFEKGAGWFSGVEIGVQETSKLKKMLTPLGENVSLSLDIDENDKTRVRQLFIDDGKNRSDFTAAGLDVIDGAPKLKNVPPFGVEINFSPEFIDAFSKSFSALGDDATLFTLLMSKRKQKMDMVLGYKQNLSDRIALEVAATTGKDTVKNPISFSAKHLKEILSAYSEVTNPVLEVSEAGLASISFVDGLFKSQYNLVQVDVED